MAPSQKPITVKLNQEELQALDAFVEHGGYNGRSHALREMAKPFMVATQVALQSQSAVKASVAMTKAMYEVTQSFPKIAKNSTKNSQQTLPGIEPVEVTIIPDPAPA